MESPLSRRDSRFQHLLQPIRCVMNLCMYVYGFSLISIPLACSELADNWNVDIAAELEDYLEELASIKISLDGGHTSLNFAEAALLIQVRIVVHSPCPVRISKEGVMSARADFVVSMAAFRAPLASTARKSSSCTAWCFTRWTW